MLFEIKNCKLTEVSNVTSGTSKAGNEWTKATAVIEKTEGAYTDTYPMLVFGDRIEETEALKGRDVDVKFSVQGREYNGRWYTDLKLQSIVPAGGEPAKEPAPATAPATAPAPAPETEDDPDGDLPF